MKSSVSTFLLFKYAPPSFTIRRAAEMLRDSSLSVKAIALALGFRNPYHFSKLFKLKTGSSPRDYRQHWRTVSAPAARTPSPTAP